MELGKPHSSSKLWIVLKIIKRGSLTVRSFWKLQKHSDTETALNTGATISAIIKMAYTKVLYPNGTAIQRLNTKIYVDTLLLANVWRYIKKEITWKSFSHEPS